MAASISERRRPRGEAGFALPLVMGAVVLLTIFMATALTRATVGLDVSSKDVAAKRAVQTAKAGLRVAIYRANGLGVDLNQLIKPSQQCLVSAGNVLGVEALPAGWNWCAPQTESLGTGARFDYRISSVATVTLSGGWLLSSTSNYLLERKVVSSGTVDGITRRVYAEITAQGSRRVTGLCLPLVPCANVLSSGSLQAYRVKPGSFRNCSAVVVPSHPTDPTTGC